MAFNHKFLATKSWHVRTPQNLAAVEAAESSAASLSRRVEQRKAILAKERALQATQALRLNHVQQHGKNATQAGPIVPTATSVAFMYEPPPGFIAVEEPEVEPEILNRDSQQTSPPSPPEDVKPIISQSMSSTSIPSAAASAPLLYNAPPPAEGAAIESYADRRERHKHMTPQQIRDELHPALKGAPVTADYVRDGAFRPNPLGIVVRDVRCLRCGGIGHASGDRECPKFAQPTLLDAQAIARDDPVTKLKALAEQQKQRAHADGSTAASSSHIPLPPSSGRTVSNGKFKLMYNDEDWTAGGLDKNDPLQQVLLAGEDDELDPSHARSRKRSKVDASSSSSDLPAEEAAFLATLSEADMKLLLKQYKQARKGSRKHDSDSSSSSDSSSESSSDSDSSLNSSLSDSSRRHSSKRKKSSKRSTKSKKNKKSRKLDRSHHRSSRSSRSRERDHDTHKKHKKRKRSRSQSHSILPRSEINPHSSQQGRAETVSALPSAAAVTATSLASPSPASAVPTATPAPTASHSVEDDLPPLLPY